MNKIVIYHHGKDSIPWGEKTHAMAEVAKRCGYQFESIDYTASNDPITRLPFQKVRRPIYPLDDVADYPGYMVV